jgi:Nucleotide modification associated domain 1
LATEKIFVSKSPIEVREIEVPDTTILQFEEDAQKIYDELLSILVKKQIDYGPYNIWHAPGGATNGLMVRMSDKLERLKNLIYKKIEPNNESLEDSFIDMANYAIIALMVQRGVWAKYAEKQK